MSAPRQRDDGAAIDFDADNDLVEQPGCRECGCAFEPMGEEDICRACDHARGDFEP